MEYLKRLWNKWHKIPSEFTEEEIKRGFTLKVHKLHGELVYGWCTAVLHKKWIRENREVFVHVCVPIPDRMRGLFEIVLKKVPDDGEKQKVFNYILSRPESLGDYK